MNWPLAVVLIFGMICATILGGVALTISHEKSKEKSKEKEKDK